MEIGAVKQSFNNELILLKKNLNQAKTQIIHKLTRKAKQLTEKKAPDSIKEKFTKKAENAVKEVLVLKKIKVRDVGKFIVTHKGKLQDFLNKPQIDNDKACARILLHKAMQEKYKLIRNKFSNIPIKDLFMSRNERLKLKKEEKLKKKEKRDRKKGKNKVVNAEGDWDVQELGIKKNQGAEINEEKSDDEQDTSDKEDQQEILEQSDEEDISDNDKEENSEQSELGSEDEESIDENYTENGSGEGFKISFKGHSDEESESGSNEEMEASDDDSEEKDISKLAPTKNNKTTNKISANEPAVKRKANENNLIDKVSKFSKTETVLTAKLPKKVNTNKKHKDNIKNKNLQNKILNNKFKKNAEDNPEVERKVVDPFFVTATGENYMSIVEPRQPDEIKEVHKQGNRQLRRAIMFGHAPKIKFRQERNKDSFNRPNSFDKSTGNKGYQDGFLRRNNFDGKSEHKFNNKNVNSNKTKFNDRNDRRTQEDAKPEKLHPSWEAKKKQSGILPFQGKKIVFD